MGGSLDAESDDEFTERDKDGGGVGSLAWGFTSDDLRWAFAIWGEPDAAESPLLLPLFCCCCCCCCGCHVCKPGKVLLLGMSRRGSWPVFKGAMEGWGYPYGGAMGGSWVEWGGAKWLAGGVRRWREVVARGPRL